MHAALLASALPHRAPSGQTQRENLVARITLTRATPSHQVVKAESPQVADNAIPASPTKLTPTIATEPHEQGSAQHIDKKATDPQSASQYVDTPLLTTLPRVVGDFFIPFPPSAPNGSFKTIITVYIDERGRTEHVYIPEGALPDVLADTVLSALSDARFAPGQVNGAPVKSSVQIEIAFESAHLESNSDGLLSPVSE